MEYLKDIEKAINYIEENLQNAISLSDCAKNCGYSQYHFLRLFKYSTGFTPADYIRKRRLSEIAKRIPDGKEHISDLAFQYGFNSKENFIRAFKSEHHILPTEYKSAANSLKLYEKIVFKSAEFSVAPRILRLEDFEVIGYKSDEEVVSNFWNKYNVNGSSRTLSGGKSVRDYGVCIWNETCQKQDYYIGIKSHDAKGNLQNTQKLVIHGGLYASFPTPPSTHGNFVSTIHKTWEYIFGKWIPESDYEFAGGYQFECYVEQSRVYSEDIYVPILPKIQ